MPLVATGIDDTHSAHSSESNRGKGGGPTIRCAERMRQMVLRAAPSAISIIGDMMRVAVTRGLSDEQMLRHLAKALNVGMHGWPLDPVVRRRLRVERFYQFNAVPIDTRRIETALASSHSEDDLLHALYRKYQRNEIGESLDPDVALGETLLHVFACANPAMQPKVPQFVMEQSQSGLNHADYLEEVCKTLGVCTDGWPLDPDERLRRRLESFYQINDPKKIDRIERLLTSDFTEEQIFTALYEKYGVDELGQPVQNERMLREQLTRLLQPTHNEKKVEELLGYWKESRLTDAELLHAVRKMLAIGDDGLPLDAAERVRTRVRMFFRANSTTAAAPPPALLQSQDLLNVKAAGEGEPPSFSISRPPGKGRSMPRLKPNPPLLTEDELKELHEDNSVLDELLLDELRTIRSHLHDHSSSDGTHSAAMPAADDRSASPLLSRLKRRVSSYFSSSKRTPGGAGGPVGDGPHVLPVLPPDAVTLDDITPQEEDSIMQKLCRRFQRNEVGEVVLPKQERDRLRMDFISYVERLVVDPAEILALATKVSQLNLSEENMWEVLRRQLDHLEEHTLHTTFREQLRTMLMRCAPRETERVDPMILCMLEDGLSQQEVLQTVMHKYGVDAAGWPLEPHKRRRTQLSMLLKRHDPEKLPLIDSLFMSMPTTSSDTDDRLYRSMCETYGSNEFGQPVSRRPFAEEEEGEEDAIEADGLNLSPRRTASQSIGTPPSSRGESPGQYGGSTSLQLLGGYNNNSVTMSLMLQPSAPAQQLEASRNSSGNGGNTNGDVPLRDHNTTLRFHSSGGNLRPVHSFALKSHLPSSPRLMSASKGDASFYEPLRDLRARDQWDGDAAAADVAAVVGEQFLKELRDKYGGPEDPRVGSSSHRVAEGVWNEEVAVPRTAAAHAFEYKSRKPSPLEAFVANPFEAMRSDTRRTIDLIHSDAHAARVQRSVWGQAKKQPENARRDDAALSAHPLQSVGTAAPSEIYLPREPPSRVIHHNLAHGTKYASLGQLQWLGD